MIKRVHLSVSNGSVPPINTNGAAVRKNRFHAVASNSDAYSLGRLYTLPSQGQFSKAQLLFLRLLNGSNPCSSRQLNFLEKGHIDLIIIQRCLIVPHINRAE